MTPPPPDLYAAWLKRFTYRRLSAMQLAWWKQPAFAAKRRELEAGLRFYATGTEDGYFAAYKILVSELEGVLRSRYPSTERIDAPHLIGLLRHDAVASFGPKGSLGFPREFTKYLAKIVFGPMEEGRLTRNSALHGVAGLDHYTQARALQVFLCLDQVYFMLPRAEAPF